MRFFLLTIFVALAFSLNAREMHFNDSTDFKNKVFTKVEVMPQFPGGEKGMIDFVAEHLNYPESAKNANISGRVFVSFIVDTIGIVRDVKILRGIGGGCDEAALEIISMMPPWFPGSQNGRPVDVKYVLPVSFRKK